MKNNIYYEAYLLLLDHFGHQSWWPSDTPFEVMVGAVLTQNTKWSNVTKAISNLKEAGLLDYRLLSQLSVDEIAQFIRPSGYYRLKSGRLKNLLNMMADSYGGDLTAFIDDDLETARDNLLAVKGIGPETADSILLYACGHPIFVIDRYTHRVFSRHNMVDEETDYRAMQTIFMDNLPHDASLYGEFHALIVRLATTYCKKTITVCDECPLQRLSI